ncbi:MAG: hypothetical protein HKO59_11085 [Phycisphaerales bacterium]|nr:hypothetical protein [Phycisphaerales bacterium]
MMVLISNAPKPPTSGAWDIFNAFKESSEIAYAADLAYVGSFDENALGGPVRGEEADYRIIDWKCLKARHGHPRGFRTIFRGYCHQFEGCA